MLDVREREDGGAIEAVAVPARPVLVRLLLLLLLLPMFPARLKMVRKFSANTQRNRKYTFELKCMLIACGLHLKEMRLV